MAPAGREEISKLTYPLEVKVAFLPISIYQVLLPPLLLALHPSKDAVEFIVFVVVETVAVGVGVGEFVGFGVLVGLGVVVGEPDGEASGVAVSREVDVASGAFLWVPNQNAKPPIAARRRTTMTTMRALLTPEESFAVSLEAGIICSSSIKSILST